MTLRLTLLVKILLLLVPTFVLVLAIGVLLIDQKDQTRSEEQLALRVGNLSARVASALGRHGAPEKPQLAEELLGLFGNEPAVRCAEWHSTDTSGQVLARYPSEVGCKSVPDAHQIAPLVLPVNDGDSWLSSIQRKIGERRARGAFPLAGDAPGGCVGSGRFVRLGRLPVHHQATFVALAPGHDECTSWACPGSGRAHRRE